MVLAQKVANFSYGKPGTNQFEEFSFWVQNGKPSDILYTYGKDRKETKLQYLGNGSLNGAKGLMVKFRNGLTLYVIPQTSTLFVTDAPGKYVKRFAWYYEGPVNGVGTFCQPCAEDEKEAIGLIKKAYMD